MTLLANVEAVLQARIWPFLFQEFKPFGQSSENVMDCEHEFQHDVELMLGPIVF